LAAEGGFIPAAAQLKPTAGGAGGVGVDTDGGVDPGALPEKGSSQTVHLEALAGLERPHAAQILESLATIGALIPAAAKSKASTGAGAGVEGAGLSEFMGRTTAGLFALGGLALYEPEYEPGAFVLEGS